MALFIGLSLFSCGLPSPSLSFSSFFPSSGSFGVGSDFAVEPVGSVGDSVATVAAVTDTTVGLLSDPVSVTSVGSTGLSVDVPPPAEI